MRTMKSILATAVVAAVLSTGVLAQDETGVVAFTFNMNSKSPGSPELIQSLVETGFPAAQLATAQFVAITIQESPEEGEYMKIRASLETHLAKAVAAKPAGEVTAEAPGAYAPLAADEFAFAGHRLLLELEHSPNAGGHIMGIVKAKTTTRFLLYCVDPAASGHVLPLSRPLYEGKITYGKATFGAALHVKGHAQPFLIAGAHLPAGFNLWFEESHYVPKRIADIHASFTSFAEQWASRPVGFGDFEVPKPVEPYHLGSKGQAVLQPEASPRVDGSPSATVEETAPTTSKGGAVPNQDGAAEKDSSPPVLVEVSLQRLRGVNDDDSESEDEDEDSDADADASPLPDSAVEDRLDPTSDAEEEAAPGVAPGAAPVAASVAVTDETEEDPAENPIEVEGDSDEINVEKGQSDVDALLAVFRRVLLIGDLNFRLRYDKAHDNECAAKGQPVCAERGSDDPGPWLKNIIISTKLYATCKACQHAMRESVLTALVTDPINLYTTRDTLYNIRQLINNPVVVWRSEEHSALVAKMFPVPIAALNTPKEEFPLPTFSRVVRSTPCKPMDRDSLSLCFQGSKEAVRKTAIDGADRGSMRATYGKGENIPAWTEAAVFFGAAGQLAYSAVLSDVTISDHVPFVIAVTM